MRRSYEGPDIDFPAPKPEWCEGAVQSTVAVPSAVAILKPVLPCRFPDVPFQHAIVPSSHGRILGDGFGDVRDWPLKSVLAAFPPP